MALKATKDTYGVETVYGIEVRRLIKAGQMIPATIEAPKGSYEEVAGRDDLRAPAPAPPPKRHKQPPKRKS